MSIFEILMLVCFGAAWPFSIYRSLVSRTAAGKSLFFLIIVFAGYICGVLHKLLHNCDGVVYLYCLNGLMVFSDILLTLRNRRLDKAAVGCP